MPKVAGSIRAYALQPRIDEAIQEVCSEYLISRDELLGKGRDYFLINARIALYGTLRNKLRMSYDDIGIVANRHRTVVARALARGGDMLSRAD